MSTEPKGTCNRQTIEHLGPHEHTLECYDWREGESAPAQPGAGYRISDEYGCNCGVGNCDPVAHAADCPLKTRPPSVNPYRSVPPAAETARDESWRNLPEGHWFFQDLPDCRDRYHVMERTIGGSVLVCSTPWHHALAERTMKGIVELHNSTATAQVKAETAMTAEQWLTEYGWPDPDKRVVNIMEAYAAHVREAAQMKIAKLEKELEVCALAREVHIKRAEAAERKLARYEALDAHLPPLYAIGDDATAELAVELVEVERKLAEVEKALRKASEWAANFPLKAPASADDLRAASEVYAESIAALASLRAESKEPVD